MGKILENTTKIRNGNARQISESKEIRAGKENFESLSELFKDLEPTVRKDEKKTESDVYSTLSANFAWSRLIHSTVGMEIDNRPFTMTAYPGSSKKWLIVSFYGQNEQEILPHLNKLMGYEPFCKYNHKENKEATASYVWDSIGPEKYFEDLSKDPGVFNLVRLEGGFAAAEASIGNKYYQEFTPQIIAEWEEMLKKNPDAEYNCNKISEILPFIKKVMPRVGKIQSLFGLSIISLEGKYDAAKEEEIVKYGLEPLVKAGILNEAESRAILDWYRSTEPTWDSNNTRRFEKEFEIDGKKYLLSTDCFRNCRDLNLTAAIVGPHLRL